MKWWTVLCVLLSSWLLGGDCCAGPYQGRTVLSSGQSCTIAASDGEINSKGLGPSLTWLVRPEGISTTLSFGSLLYSHTPFNIYKILHFNLSRRILEDKSRTLIVCFCQLLLLILVVTGGLHHQCVLPGEVANCPGCQAS